MKKYIIIITCGAYNAPSLYIEATTAGAAIEQAKEKSGLSKFNNWAFIAKER
jgi:hypothetical protein